MLFHLTLGPLAPLATVAASKGSTETPCALCWEHWAAWELGDRFRSAFKLLWEMGPLPLKLLPVTSELACI